MMVRSSFLQSVASALSLAPLCSVHIATALFGLAGVLGSTAGLSAIEVTFGRTLFAALVLILVCRGVNTAVLPDFKPRNSWLLLLSGVLLAFHWVAFFASIQLSTVAIGLVMFSTSPVFLVLLEPIFYKEKWHLVDMVAALVVLIGVLILSGASSGDFTYSRGVTVGLISGFSFAVLQLLNRRLTNTSGALATATIQNTVAAVVLLPLVIFKLNEFTVNQWGLLVVLGVMCTALAHTLFINALKKMSASSASLIAAGLEPIYGIVLAALLLSQMPTANVIVGGMIILMTVLVVTLKRRNSKAQ